MVFPLKPSVITEFRWVQNAHMFPRGTLLVGPFSSARNAVRVDMTLNILGLRETASEEKLAVQWRGRIFKNDDKVKTQREMRLGKQPKANFRFFKAFLSPVLGQLEVHFYSTLGPFLVYLKYTSPTLGPLYVHFVSNLGPFCV